MRDGGFQVLKITPGYIRAVREEHGMTQAVFGEVLGFSEKHIYSVENGRTPISNSLAKLVHLFYSVPEARGCLSKKTVMGTRCRKNQ